MALSPIEDSSRNSPISTDKFAIPPAENPSSLRLAPTRAELPSSDAKGVSERTRTDFSTAVPAPVNPDNGRPGVGAHPPDHARVKEKWNDSWLTIFRVFAAFWVFVLMGVSDAVVGAILPSFQADYGISYTLVSLVFLSQTVGYSIAAVTNGPIHHHFGQRGIALFASGCQILSFVTACVRPPFGVLVAAFLFSALGTSLHDSAWNAWIGGLENSHALLGFLHGFYGLGGCLGPIISTFMIASTSLKWFNFYYILVGIATMELLVSGAAFWKADGPAYRRHIGHIADSESVVQDEEKGGVGTENSAGSSATAVGAPPLEKNAEVNAADTALPAALATAPSSNPRKPKSLVYQSLVQRPYARVVWLLTLSFALCVSAEFSISGWVVTFMLDVRAASRIASGMTSAGFWLGVTAGRLCLGFLTSLMGDRFAVVLFTIISICLQLVFWFVPNFYASAVAVGLLGLCVGPVVPGCVGLAMRLMPVKLHVTALGFVTAAAGIGGTIFPFLVGVVSESRGVGVLQPFVLALFLALLGVVVCFPRTRPGWKGFLF